MSKNPKSDGDSGVSRRGLLEKAALAVGAATSVVAARTALARSSDVVMDSAGRVLVRGSALPTQRPEGSFDEAAKLMGTNDQCNNGGPCTGSDNKGCSNAAHCVAPRSMQPTRAAPNTNAPLTTPKVNTPGGGSKRK
jgi:hypothetical protein